MVGLPICRCGVASDSFCLVCGDACCTSHGRRVEAAVIDRQVHSTWSVCDDCSPSFNCFECGREATRSCGCGRRACSDHSLLSASSLIGVDRRTTDTTTLKCNFCLRVEHEREQTAARVRQEAKARSALESRSLPDLIPRFLAAMQQVGNPGAGRFFEKSPTVKRTRREEKRLKDAIKRERARSIYGPGLAGRKRSRAIARQIEGETFAEALYAIEQADNQRLSDEGLMLGWIVDSFNYTVATKSSSEGDSYGTRAGQIALLADGTICLVHDPASPRPQYARVEDQFASNPAQQATIARQLGYIAAKHGVVLPD